MINKDIETKRIKKTTDIEDKRIEKKSGLNAVQPDQWSGCLANRSARAHFIVGVRHEVA